MKPKITDTQFGSITIDNNEYTHDVIIRLNGQVKKRKKKLSKAVYGTSHIISLEEARHVYEKGTESIIIGAGQYLRVSLSVDAAKYFKKHKCQVKLLQTHEAMEVWNDAKGRIIGLFHVTC